MEKKKQIKTRTQENKYSKRILFIFFNKYWVQVELSSPQQSKVFGNFINSCRLISQYTIDHFTLFNASNELLYLENILKLRFLLDWHVSDRVSEKIHHLSKISSLPLRKSGTLVYSEDLYINILLLFILLFIPLLSCFISLNTFNAWWWNQARGRGSWCI